MFRRLFSATTHCWKMMFIVFVVEDTDDEEIYIDLCDFFFIFKFQCVNLNNNAIDRKVTMMVFNKAMLF